MKTALASHEEAKVSYKTAAGDVTATAWSSVDADLVVRGAPWRPFPWWVGQRNYSGWYWCATERAHVGYESRLELSRLIVADFDPHVKNIASQPFHLEAVVDGKRFNRVLDYLACTDTVPLAIDVKPSAVLAKPEVADLLALTRTVIESRGWRYEVATEQPRIEYTNIRFLSGYRRPWLCRPEVLAALRQSAQQAGSLTINDIVAGSELPKPVALAGFFHLLWRHEFSVDLTRRLSGASLAEVKA